MRFIKNPMCLQKASKLCFIHILHYLICRLLSCLSMTVSPLLSAETVFTAYYQNNPPGVYFSAPVFLTFLWALLKAGLVSDIFSVLSVSLAHKIVVSLVSVHLVTVMSCCSSHCNLVESRACSVVVWGEEHHHGHCHVTLHPRGRELCFVLLSC